MVATFDWHSAGFAERSAVQGLKLIITSAMLKQGGCDDPISQRTLCLLRRETAVNALLPFSGACSRPPHKKPPARLEYR